MKYFIGYAISGEAKNYLYNLTKEISEQFDTWPLHEKIPPHLTVYRPFYTDNLDTVRNVLQQARQTIQGNLAFSGFNRFDDRVVFVDVEVNMTLKKTVLDLREKLLSMPGMQVEDFPDWHPHATIANHLPAETIVRIWDYVSTLQKPHFTIPFDNIAIFRSEGDRKWVIEESFLM